MTKPRILSLGEALWDLFPNAPRFGGAPANFACHAATLGAEVSMGSAIGDDSAGQKALETLKAFGIDVSTIQIRKRGATGTVAVTLDEVKVPAFEIHKDVAWDQLAWTPELEERLLSADAVYFGTLGQRSRESRSTIHRSLNQAKQSGIRRVLDINLRPPFFDADLIRNSIDKCTLLKLSSDELEAVAQACDIVEARPEDKLLALRDRYQLELVAMTRGSEGALLVSSTEVVDQPGLPCNIRDTVGAGDAFTAALIVGLFREDPLQEIALLACQYASSICGQFGAVPDLEKEQIKTNLYNQ